MTSRDFCYWLQGYFELLAQDGQSTPMGLSANQTICVKNHLALVFKHEIDPAAGGPEQQAALNAIHQGVSKEDVQKAITEAIAKIPKPEPAFDYNTPIRC